MIEWVKDNILAQHKISANQSVSTKVSYCLMDLNVDENKNNNNIFALKIKSKCRYLQRSEIKTF